MYSKKTKIIILVSAIFLLLSANAFAGTVYDWSDAPGYASAHNRGWGTVGGAVGTWQWLGATWTAEYDARYDDGDPSDDGVWWSVNGGSGYYGHESVILGQTIWLKVVMHENPTVTNDFTDYLRVWIDWNGNKDFEVGTSELAYSFDWTEDMVQNNLTLYIPLEIPLDATVGTTYMRVRLCCGTNGQYNYPYGNTTQGETEDWALTITGTTTEIPEPVTIILFLGGILGIASKKLKKK